MISAYLLLFQLKWFIPSVRHFRKLCENIHPTLGRLFFRRCFCSQLLLLPGHGEIQITAVMLIGCRTLGLNLDFSEPLFPELYSEDNDRIKEIM